MELVWNDIPGNFGLCTSETCPMAAECLHRAAADLFPEKENPPLDWLYVNHHVRAAAERGEGCRVFLPNRPVRAALGFRHVLDDELSHNNRRIAVRKLQRLFSSGARYYDRKNGKVPLTPSEQAAVSRILIPLGAADPVEFDAYIEMYDFGLRMDYK